MKKLFIIICAVAVVCFALFTGCATNPVKPTPTPNPEPEPEPQQPTEITVVFDGNGGVWSYGLTSQTVDSADKLNPPVFEKRGYSFDGWQPALDGITADTTVSAVWVANEYTITFLTDESYTCSAETATVTYDGSLSSLPVPEYIGEGTKHFVGWEIVSEDAENGKLLLSGTSWKYIQGYSVKARWSDNEFNINYQGIEDAEFDTEMPTGYSTSDTEATTLPTPKRTYKVFLGWTGGSGVDDITEPTLNLVIEPGSVGDRTYVAHWSEQDYRVDIKLGNIVNGKWIYADAPSGEKEFSVWLNDGESLGNRLVTPTFTGASSLDEVFYFEGWYLFPGDDEANAKVTVAAETVFDQSIMQGVTVITVWVYIRTNYLIGI